MTIENLFGSICVSDIPRHLITTGKNGKKYLNIDIRKRKAPDAFGHTHFIKVYDRNARDGQKDTFIGQLKASYQADATDVPVNTPPPMPMGYNNDDDIPF